MNVCPSSIVRQRIIFAFNFRSSIKESYNIVEGRHSASEGGDCGDNHVEIVSVVETDDGHPDSVDDLHPLVDQDVLAYLTNEDYSPEVDIVDNNNIEVGIGRY